MNETGVLPDYSGTIGWAIMCMRAGRRVCRSEWDGYRYLYLMPQETRMANGLAPFRMDEKLLMQSFIVMRTAQGTHVPWSCSQADLLAYDWEVLDIDDDS